MVSAKRFGATRILIRAGKPAKSHRFIFAESKVGTFKRGRLSSSTCEGRRSTPAQTIACCG